MRARRATRRAVWPWRLAKAQAVPKSQIAELAQSTDIGTRDLPTVSGLRRQVVVLLLVLAATPAALSMWDSSVMQTPPPREGDVVWYHAQLGDLGAALRLRWTDSTSVQVPGQPPQPGRTLSADALADDSWTHAEFHVGEHGQPVSWALELQNATAVEFVFAASVNGFGTGAYLGNTLPANSIEFIHAFREQRGAGPMPCGLVNGYQGTSSPLRSPWFGGDCGDGAFRHLGAARLAGKEGDAQVFGNPETRVWLHASTPYPIQLERATPTGTLLLQMTNLHLEGQPIVWSDQSHRYSPPSPAVHQSPRQIYGPDETGVGHSFPLSSAFEKARMSRFDTGLSRFLAEHPAAYVSAAGYAFIEQQEQSYHAWTFQVSDGVSTIALQVRASPPKAGELATRQESPFEVYSHTDLPTTAPLPAVAPAKLPDLRELLARNPHRNSATPAPPAWAFSITCNNADCTQARTWVAAGTSQLVAKADAPGPVYVTGLTGTSWSSILILAGMDSHGPDFVIRGSTVGGSGALPGSVPAGTSPARLTVPAQVAPMLGWVTGLALLAVAAAWISKLTLAPLFTRLQASRLLNHPLRARTHEAIVQNPGIHHGHLRERVGIARGTFEHHLRKLVEGGLVTRHKEQGYVCYFVGQPTKAQVLAAPTLKSHSAQAIHKRIQERPGITAQELAAEISVEPSTVSHHVSRMLKAGLIERQRRGRAYALHPIGDVTPSRSGDATPP